MENRVWALYCRVNRRIRWEYATYCGRWETVERALAEVKDRYDDPVEYRIENKTTNDVLIGYANA